MSVLKVLMIVIALVILIQVFFCFYFLPVWIKALASKCHVQILSLIGMRLRGNPPGLIVDVLIALRNSGVDLSADEIERVYMAQKYNLRRTGGKQRRARELVRLVKDSRDTASSGTGT